MLTFSIFKTVLNMVKITALLKNLRNCNFFHFAVNLFEGFKISAYICILKCISITCNQCLSNWMKLEKKLDMVKVS